MRSRRLRRVLLVAGIVLVAVPGVVFGPYVLRLRHIKADPAAGFHSDFHLYVSPGAKRAARSGTPMTILVQPNNSGINSDDIEVHRKDAWWTGFGRHRLANELEVALLVPAFPRPATDWRVYTHALDHDVLTTARPDLARLDLQLIAMVDRARETLAADGMPADEKFLIQGFSASGMFANRFAALHPDRVKAVAAGSPGGWPIAPLGEWQGEILPYPAGIADLEALVGKPFDAAAYRALPQLIVMGALDDNDSVDFRDGWDEEPAAQVDRLFGTDPQARWGNAETLYRAAGADVRFVRVEGVGHDRKDLQVHSTRFFAKVLAAAGSAASGVAVAGAAVTGALAAPGPDPLPSWNPGATKEAIVRFVNDVTTAGGPRHVPPAERIAVFDNDGTLWAEQPMYAQFAFALDRVQALAPQHPEWQQKQPFKAALERDLATVLKGGEHALVELVMATHAGQTTDDFAQVVTDWVAVARHPKTGRPFTEMVYQPMLELLSYLRDSGFKTYIVSGGGIEFMRPWAEAVYGIPPEQVIGSSIRTRFEMRSGTPVLVRLPEVNFIDDRAGKPVGIQQHIGRRPLAAFGNSDGDLEMLQWTTAGAGARFALIVHHTDAEREWAYDRASPIGRLDQALDEARSRGWTIVDMKRDWRVIHPAPRAPGAQR